MTSICFSDEKNESPQRLKDPDKDFPAGRVEGTNSLDLVTSRTTRL